jgi:hypothetical protein
MSFLDGSVSLEPEANRGTRSWWGGGEIMTSEPGTGGFSGVSAERESGFEPSGDERVDAAVARLGELAGRPVAGHVAVYQDVHRRLQEVLASIDEPEGDEPDEVPSS